MAVFASLILGLASFRYVIAADWPWQLEEAGHETWAALGDMWWKIGSETKQRPRLLSGKGRKSSDSDSKDEGEGEGEGENKDETDSDDEAKPSSPTPTPLTPNSPTPKPPTPTPPTPSPPTSTPTATPTATPTGTPTPMPTAMPASTPTHNINDENNESDDENNESVVENATSPTLAPPATEDTDDSEDSDTTDSDTEDSDTEDSEDSDTADSEDSDTGGSDDSDTIPLEFSFTMMSNRNVTQLEEDVPFMTEMKKLGLIVLGLPTDKTDWIQVKLELSSEDRRRLDRNNLRRLSSAAISVEYTADIPKAVANDVSIMSDPVALQESFNVAVENAATQSGVDYDAAVDSSSVEDMTSDLGTAWTVALESAGVALSATSTTATSTTATTITSTSTTSGNSSALSGAPEPETTKQKPEIDKSHMQLSVASDRKQLASCALVAAQIVIVSLVAVVPKQ